MAGGRRCVELGTEIGCDFHHRTDAAIAAALIVCRRFCRFRAVPHRYSGCFDGFVIVLT